MATALSSSELYQEIVVTLTKLFGIEAAKVSMDSQLVNDLDLDSIDMVDLLSTASDRFQVDLSPYDFEGVSSIGEFIVRLEQQLQKQG